MSELFKGNPASRRAFLRGSVAAVAGAVTAGAAHADGPDPLITEVQPWAQGWGLDSNIKCNG